MGSQARELGGFFEKVDGNDPARIPQLAHGSKQPPDTGTHLWGLQMSTVSNQPRVAEGVVQRPGVSTRTHRSIESAPQEPAIGVSLAAWHLSLSLVPREVVPQLSKVDRHIHRQPLSPTITIVRTTDALGRCPWGVGGPPGGGGGTSGGDRRGEGPPRGGNQPQERHLENFDGLLHSLHCGYTKLPRNSKKIQKLFR